MAQPNKEWVFRQFFFTEALRLLHDHFVNLQINYMPIKGAYLIVSGCAGHFSDRKMCDIDILVLESDMPQVIEYFKNVTGVRTKPNYWPFEFSFFLPCLEATAFVEIHTLLNYPERFHLPTEALFSRSVVQKRFLHLPSPEDSLIIFLCHQLVHIPFEIRTTVWQEIEVLSSQEGFSWNRFWNLATHTGIRQFFNMFLLHYSKVRAENVPLQKPSYYARFLAFTASRNIYESMPVWLRRLALELPFANIPLKLIRKKRRSHR